MNSEIFTDSAMVEIFRSEVETHVESLTAGLLALERDPGDTSHVDEMMRAAHSIKGASRIVGIDPAVRVAHVMEDGFIAAQNGKLLLRPEHVDVLLRGVDLLSRIAVASKDVEVDWKIFDDDVRPLVAEISTALSDAAATPKLEPTKSPLQSVQHTLASSLPVEFSAPISQDPCNVLSPPQPLPSLTSNVLKIPFPAFFDAAAAETVRKTLIAELDAKSPVVHFDLALTCDFDPIGLAFLAAVPNFARGVIKVELQGIRAELWNLLQATGIDRLYAEGAV